MSVVFVFVLGLVVGGGPQRVGTIGELFGERVHPPGGRGHGGGLADAEELAPEVVGELADLRGLQNPADALAALGAYLAPGGRPGESHGPLRLVETSE